jgi:hypothetical protein
MTRGMKKGIHRIQMSHQSVVVRALAGTGAPARVKSSSLIVAAP